MAHNQTPEATTLNIRNYLVKPFAHSCKNKSPLNIIEQQTALARARSMASIDEGYALQLSWARQLFMCSCEDPGVGSKKVAPSVTKRGQGPEETGSQGSKVPGNGSYFESRISKKYL